MRNSLSFEMHVTALNVDSTLSSGISSGIARDRLDRSPDARRSSTSPFSLCSSCAVLLLKLSAEVWELITKNKLLLGRREGKAELKGELQERKEMQEQSCRYLVVSGTLQIQKVRDWSSTEI